MPPSSPFRTVLHPNPDYPKIGLRDSLLSLGSCFSEHIGHRLLARKMPVSVNPFGILFHPLNLARALERLTEGKVMKANELVCRDGLWHSWDHHGRYSAPNPEKALEKMNRSLSEARHRLLKADWLLLTLGTARGYLLRENGRLVANCHKFPSDTFQRVLFPAEKIVSGLLDALAPVRKLRPNLQVILTVSPVRHIRDGLIANQESKAVLTLASRQLASELDYIHYFPGYELLLDDLRDYRFYASDMVHPSEEAIDYIWKHFCQSFFSGEDQARLEQIERLLRDLNHRPLHPDSSGYRTFLNQLVRKLEQAQASHPGMDFRPEIDQVRDRLEKIDPGIP